jgi:hypothetical protein
MMETKYNIELNVPVLAVIHAPRLTWIKQMYT